MEWGWSSVCNFWVGLVLKKEAGCPLLHLPPSCWDTVTNWATTLDPKMQVFSTSQWPSTPSTSRLFHLFEWLYLWVSLLFFCCCCSSMAYILWLKINITLQFMKSHNMLWTMFSRSSKIKLNPVSMKIVFWTTFNGILYKQTNKKLWSLFLSWAYPKFFHVYKHSCSSI